MLEMAVLAFENRNKEAGRNRAHGLALYLCGKIVIRHPQEAVLRFTRGDEAAH
jgi:hypothetical protein